MMMTPTAGQPFDAAPFAHSIECGAGLMWEDPREIHRVVVRFAQAPPPGLRLQYWRTRWPQQRLPKDKVPGGGSVGWWELGNWFTGQWQEADAEVTVDGAEAEVTFRPVNHSEFPELDNFPATYRATLKIRLIADGPLPDVEALEAYTDSVWEPMRLTVLLREAPTGPPAFEVFNGHLGAATALAPERYALDLWCTRNPDPNSFDKTYLTIRGDQTVTVGVDDLRHGPVCVPDCGLCVVVGQEERDYTGVWAQVAVNGRRPLYDLVAQMPEQTWSRAWGNMVPKRQRIYLPLAADGARHKFGLNADGSVFWRTNNSLLTGCPGRDTERLAADVDRLTLSFGLGEPCDRCIQEGTLPVGITRWEVDGVRIGQVAYATPVTGTDPQGPPPPADAPGVLMVQFRFDNCSAEAHTVRVALQSGHSGGPEELTADGEGTLRAGERVRALVETGGQGQIATEGGQLAYVVTLAPGAGHAITVKIPYLAPDPAELGQLRALDFDREREAVASYWRRRIGQGMKLVIPEPDLQDFHAAHAAHLLINCEKEPGSENRFARVGSFTYAAYGNESCMMIVDLDRRGYHEEARQCLEAFMQYQGTVPLPGDFSSHEGVLYGAHGYEHGGYNQHHGWILWCLVEHFRFTRDEAWLRHAAPHILTGAQWIIRERARTVGSDDIGAGLLPCGSLEDIGDWWQWFSTNVYSWRGLDAAAWALEQMAHPQAGQVRAEADEYRTALLRACARASQRSPVVRLRDGSFVAHIPSEPHRRGRSFGWICETLEGAIHLLITGLIPVDCPQALNILRDYEDNLYLSELYGYDIPDFDQHWFDWGGFSMQACLLLDVEPYLYRDDVKHALRAMFNGIAANFFPDVRMIAEHALPELGDYRGDHYKTSDEANAAGWLRYLFVREEGELLLLGQAVPREWLRPGNRIGVENAATHFGPLSLTYEAAQDSITAHLSGPRRNPPERIRLRFRVPEGRVIQSVTVNGQPAVPTADEWVDLAGDTAEAEVRVTLGQL